MDGTEKIRLLRDQEVSNEQVLTYFAASFTLGGKNMLRTEICFCKNNVYFSVLCRKI